MRIVVGSMKLQMLTPSQVAGGAPDALPRTQVTDHFGRNNPLPIIGARGAQREFTRLRLIDAAIEIMVLAEKATAWPAYGMHFWIALNRGFLLAMAAVSDVTLGPGHPFFATLRDGPRHKELLRKIALPE
jgi:hypothetical protein